MRRRLRPARVSVALGLLALAAASCGGGTWHQMFGGERGPSRASLAELRDRCLRGPQAGSNPLADRLSRVLNAVKRGAAHESLMPCKRRCRAEE